MNCKRDILAGKTIWRNKEQRACLKVYLYDDGTFDVLGVQYFGQNNSRTWAEASGILPDLLDQKVKEILAQPARVLTDSAEKVFADLRNLYTPEYYSRTGETWQELAAKNIEWQPLSASKT